MKVILKFDTEKDEDINLYKIYIKAENMGICLHNIKQILRRYNKYVDLTESQLEAIEKMSQEIYDVITDEDLNSIIDNS